MTSFSRKVRDIRKRAGLNQTEFAAALGVGQSTVSRWESLKYEQSPETEALLKIAAFADVDVMSLYRNEAETIHRRSGEGLFVKVIARALTEGWSESGRWEDEAVFEVQLPAAKSWPDYSMDGIVLQDDSMNDLYAQNSIVFAMSCGGSDEPPLVDGDRVVVVRKNRQGLLETTVREYQLDEDGKIWLWPKSDNPRFQQPFSTSGDEMGANVVSVEIIAIVAAAFVFERVTQISIE